MFSYLLFEEWLPFEAKRAMNSTAGEVEKPSFLTVDWILAEFGSNNTSRKRQYKQFVMDGMKEEFSWKDMKGQILLGTDSFVENMSEFLKDTEMLKEIPTQTPFQSSFPMIMLCFGFVRF